MVTFITILGVSLYAATRRYLGLVEYPKYSGAVSNGGIEIGDVSANTGASFNGTILREAGDSRYSICVALGAKCEVFELTQLNVIVAG